MGNSAVCYENIAETWTSGSNVGQNEDIVVQGSSGSIAFDFDSWAKAAGLTRKTEEVLRSEELVTDWILLLLDCSDIRTLNLPLGQRKALQTAISDLRCRRGQADHVTDQASIDTPNTGQCVRKQAPMQDQAEHPRDQYVAVLNPTVSVLTTEGMDLDCFSQTLSNLLEGGQGPASVQPNIQEQKSSNLNFGQGLHCQHLLLLQLMWSGYCDKRSLDRVDLNLQRCTLK